MSYLNLQSILNRLRSGVAVMSDGEIKTILNYLVEQVNELSGQVESLRRSESTRGSQEENSYGGVRRGRKPKQNSGETGETSGDA